MARAYGLTLGASNGGRVTIAPLRANGCLARCCERPPVSAVPSACGFTLIEILGVLAVIAILASILIPVVFEAIHNARVENCATTVNTVKAACVQHFAKYGSLGVDGSVGPTSQIVLDGNDSRASEFDLVLLREGLLDKPFIAPIGSAYVELVAAVGPDVQVNGVNAAYDLDGGGLENDATGSTVATAVIIGVSLDDARGVNNAIDGPALGEDNGGNDFRGRVKYAKPLTADGNSGGGNGNGNGNSNGNGNGLGGGNGNGGQNNGNGNGGQDNGNGNGGNTGSAGHGKAWAWGHHREDLVDVHIYLTHR